MHRRPLTRWGDRHSNGEGAAGYGVASFRIGLRVGHFASRCIAPGFLRVMPGGAGDMGGACVRALARDRVRGLRPHTGTGHPSKTAGIMGIICNTGKGMADCGLQIQVQGWVSTGACSTWVVGCYMKLRWLFHMTGPAVGVVVIACGSP